MNLNLIEERINKLRLLKRHYDLEYWKNNITIQTDEIYDQITTEFNELLNKYPQFKKQNDDVLESVYMNTLEEVTHKNRMLSLDKCFSIDELLAWYNKQLNKITIKNVSELVFEYKIDGFAICLEYNNGILVRGSTRGNGLIGDDITATVFHINDIPKKLCKNFTGEISGEIYMKKSSLELLNNQLKLEGKDILKNVRNGASGIATRKDTSKKHASYLNFLCYKAIDYNNKFKTYLEEMNFAKELQFNVVMDLKKCIISTDKLVLNSQTIDNLFKKFSDERDNLDLDIDGIVIKINDKSIQEMLGEQDRYPNWAIAYKFPAIEKITKLLGIEWEYGARDGRLTPMAIIEPIEIGGTTIKRPTLHNWDRIKELDIKIGDTIKVSRRGDVIPHVEGVLKELRPSNCSDVDIPTCPLCNERSIIDGAYVKCKNDYCQGKLNGKINVFINSMEIENLGPNTIDKLIENKKICSIPDLYKLKEDDISSLDKLGEKSAKKILSNINNSKKEPLWKVLTGLSIPLVGEKTARIIEQRFKSLKTFSETFNNYNEISGLGNVVFNNITKWLSDINNRSLLEALIELEIGNTIEEILISEHKLDGLKIAFTGKLQSWTREQCKKVILSNGGTPWDIKKEISILLIGDGARSNKIDKAKKLGAKIVTEDEFLNMIK